MKKALVLSGGSIKGAFQAGAIAQLLADGFKPEGLFGISAGALNSAFLASQAGGQIKAGQSVDWPKIGEALVSFWSSRVTGFNAIAIKKPYAFFDAIFGKFDGLIDPIGLKSLLGEVISAENVVEFSKEGRLFSVGAVDVWSGQIIYSEQIQYSHLVEHVLASASIPPVFPVVKIPLAVEMAFVDGGVRDIVPLQRAISHGFADIIAVVCQPRDYVGEVYPIPGSIVRHVERLIDILLTEIVDNDLAHIKTFIEIAKQLPKDLVRSTKELSHYIDIREPQIIRPNAMDPWLNADIMNFDSSIINQMIQAGRDAAKGHAAKRL